MTTATVYVWILLSLGASNRPTTPIAQFDTLEACQSQLQYLNKISYSYHACINGKPV
jgi:hypothetical protein